MRTLFEARDRKRKLLLKNDEKEGKNWERMEHIGYNKVVIMDSYTDPEARSLVRKKGEHGCGDSL